MVVRYESSVPAAYLEVENDYSIWSSVGMLRYSSDNVLEVLRRGITEQPSSASANNLVVNTATGGVVLRGYPDYEYYSREYSSPDGIKRMTSERVLFPSRVRELPEGWVYSVYSFPGTPILTMNDLSEERIGAGRLPNFILDYPLNMERDWGWCLAYKLFDKPSELKYQDPSGREFVELKHFHPALYVWMRLRLEYEDGTVDAGTLLLEMDNQGLLNVILTKSEQTTDELGNPIWQVRSLKDVMKNGLSSDLATEYGRSQYSAVFSAQLPKKTVAGKDMFLCPIMFLDGHIVIGCPEHRAADWSPEICFRYDSVDKAITARSAGKVETTSAPSDYSEKDVYKKVQYVITGINIGVKFASVSLTTFPIVFASYGEITYSDVGQAVLFQDSEWLSSQNPDKHIPQRYQVKCYRKDLINVRIAPYGNDVHFNLQMSSDTSARRSPVFYYVEYYFPTYLFRVRDLAPVEIPLKSMNMTYDITGYSGNITLFGRELVNNERLVNLFKGIVPAVLYFGRMNSGDSWSDVKRSAKYLCGEDVVPGRLEDLFTVKKVKVLVEPSKAGRTVAESSLSLNFRDRTAGLREEMLFMLPIHDGWIDELAIRDILSRTYLGDVLVRSFRNRSLILHRREGFRLSYGTMKQPLWMFQEGITARDAIDRIVQFVHRWFIPWPDGKILYADYASYDLVISNLDTGNFENWSGLKFHENPAAVDANFTEIMNLEQDIDARVVFDQVFIFGVTPMAVPVKKGSQIVWEMDPQKWGIIVSSVPDFQNYWYSRTTYRAGWCPWSRRYIERDPNINTQKAADAVAEHIYRRNCRPYVKVSFTTLGRTDLFPLLVFELEERDLPGAVKFDINLPDCAFNNRNVFRIVSMSFNLDGERKNFTTSITGERVYGAAWEYILTKW
jgi:hypothetical protein